MLLGLLIYICYLKQLNKGCMYLNMYVLLVRHQRQKLMVAFRAQAGHFCSLLPTPKEIVNKLSQLFLKFSWKDTDKVTRVSLINDYEKGSLKMIDLESVAKSLYNVNNAGLAETTI